MDMININTIAVIEYSKGLLLYPTHEVLLSEDALPLEGLLQSCEEFILAVPNSSMTLKRKTLGVELYIENFENPSTLTIHYYDVSNYSLTAKEEIIQGLPKSWKPSKEAVESFPQILGDLELKEDMSSIPGFTEVRMESDEKIWVELPKPVTLTEFLKTILKDLGDKEQLVFKIPTYPLVEVQDTEKIGYRQLWLVREK